MNVGKKIRMKRVEKDIMVKELAEAVGVTLQHMSAVENGRKTASLKLLRKIAKELDGSLYEFIEEEKIKWWLIIIVTIFIRSD